MPPAVAVASQSSFPPTTFNSLRSFYIMSDTCLSHTMQHFETGRPTSSRLDIEAWVRGVSSAHLMSSSPKKKMAQRPSATKSDDSRSTWSMTRKGEGAGSKTVGFTVREKPASSAASGYDLISKAQSSSLHTLTSSNGTFATKSSSSRKKTAAKRGDLALLNPKIQFRAFEEAEDWGIEFSQAIKDLWSRCHASLLVVFDEREWWILMLWFHAGS